MYQIYVCPSGFSVFKDHKHVYQYLPNLKYIINNKILSKKNKIHKWTNICENHSLEYYHYLISSENHFIIIVKHFFGIK